MQYVDAYEEEIPEIIKLTTMIYCQERLVDFSICSGCYYNVPKTFLNKSYNKLICVVTHDNEYIFNRYYYFVYTYEFGSPLIVTHITNENANELIYTNLPNYTVQYLWLSIPHYILMDQNNIYYSIAISTYIDKPFLVFQGYELRKYIRLYETKAISNILKKKLEPIRFINKVKV